MALIAKYKLKKDLPQLKAGAIFEHRDYDKNYPDRGNIGCGVMILGWLNGSTQHGWCGETFIIPGQLAEDREWFEPLKITEKEQILAEIEEDIEMLKERIRSL